MAQLRSESEVNFLKPSDGKSEGSIPQDQGQPFLPFFNNRFQVSSSFKLHVCLLLQTFLNLCYFSLLIPFRIKRTSSKKDLYTIQTNIVQQILSTCLISSATIYGLLDARYYLEQNLKEKPHKAFGYAYGLIRGFIPVFWIITFWLKRKWFSQLLTICQGHHHHHTPHQGISSSQSRLVPSWKLRLVVDSMVMLTLPKVLFESFYDFGGLDTFLGSYSGTALYNLYLKSNDSGVAPEELWESPWLVGLGYGVAFISCLLFFVEYMFDLFCFIGAAMVYAACAHFTDEMKKLMSQVSSTKILKLVHTNYADLVAILNSINEIFGSLIVLYFLGSYPTLVCCLFGLFRKISVSYGAFYLHKILLFILVALTAAEGNGKIGEFKEWLFLTSSSSSKDELMRDGNLEMDSDTRSSANPLDLSSLNILHREVSTETLGLKGYKFFTVTHGLIGTMMGIVVTYAIVMLQFEMDVDGYLRGHQGEATTTPTKTITSPIYFSKTAVYSSFYNLSDTYDVPDDNSTVELYPLQ